MVGNHGLWNVDPNVLDNCGIDSKEFSGFAFGMGIDRIALLLHQISDIRLLVKMMSDSWSNSNRPSEYTD